MIAKYSDDITVRVYHHIITDLNTGIIGHIEDRGDVTDIEEIKKYNNGNIEICICVTD